MLPTTTAGSENILNLGNFGFLTRPRRVTAWVRNFIANARNAEHLSGPLTTEEIQQAETHLVETAQGSAFLTELNCIKKRDESTQEFTTS